jgi:hypothetical protein
MVSDELQSSSKKNKILDLLALGLPLLVKVHIGGTKVSSN